jgi:DNA-binding winged helix-turn-helix (wHTH) protein
MTSEHAARSFRFGAFEADTKTGELRKAGVRLRLPDQPFRVLVLLLERRGEILTRDELRQQLWPDGTFVDFDHSLNSIVNKLRDVLGDSANNPRFIETLARRGYRLLVPVSVSVGTESPSRVSSAEAAREVSTPSVTSGSLLTRVQDLPSVPHGYIRVLLLLIQIMYVSFYIAALARISGMEDVMEQIFRLPGWIAVAAIVSAAIGIPVRLYLLSAISFNVKDVGRKFHRIFVPIFLLDAFWALAPFFLIRQIGWGLALAATAALLYVPFAQRTLILMRDRPHRES